MALNQGNLTQNQGDLIQNQGDLTWVISQGAVLNAPHMYFEEAKEANYQIPKHAKRNNNKKTSEQTGQNGAINSKLTNQVSNSNKLRYTEETEELTYK